MASVNTYLNFLDQTEEAFLFYQSVFGGAFTGGISRFGDMPPQEGQAPMSEETKQQIMHISLPILGGVHTLMGNDCPPEMGFTVNVGNNVHISVSPDSREETKKLFEALAEGGTVTMELQDMFWGAYYGSCTDKFGIQWMFNCENKGQ